MATPVYCILSGGAVHCVSVDAFSSKEPEKLARNPEVDLHKDTPVPQNSLSPAALNIKSRNLLFTLNNPSLSDLESENCNTSDRRNSNALSSDDEHLSPAIVLPRPKIPVLLPSFNDGDDLHKNGNARPTLQLNIETPVPDNDDEVPQNLESLLDDYKTHAVYLPQFSVDIRNNLDSDYTQIRLLLAKIFPSWSADDAIFIKRLTGGITNMLLSCTHEPSQETLLMRVYGQGTNLIIDRHREFVSHLVLNSLHLAPPVHARFANGLIYGFLEGRSLDPKELANPYLYPLIAQQLGNWHSKVDCDNIEDGIEKLRKYTARIKNQLLPALRPITPVNSKQKREKSIKKAILNIWDLIDDWILVVPANDALVKIFKDNLPDQDVNIDNVRDVIHREFRWMKSTLSNSTKSPVVVSHCDLLSGNIIIPSTAEFEDKLKASSEFDLGPLLENPIQFIDYEYMLPAPRAFDIANHFAEWQGFDCDRSAIPEPTPENPVLVKWCKGYLNNADASEEEINGLINEIAYYYGMPGFYWGIWSMIQSELSTIDFNYAEYSGLRLEEYWSWKTNYLRRRNSA